MVLSAVARPLESERSAEEDAALVRLAANGDREAFQALHERYAPTVHGLVLARAPRDVADDLIQDVFLMALQRLPSLRDPRAFGAWLCTIARNRVADHHRRRRTLVPLSHEEGRPDPDKAQAAQVMRAIRALPDTYAETLTLRLVEGMTGPEIAARTGMTSGSVRVNLHRGMAMLRAALGVEVPR
jgi:RNA polymerase sigma-70 factor, ECF subfamily